MWTKEQFDAWKHDTRTVEFLRFLREVRVRLTAQWADGEEMTAHQQSIAQTYGDIISLDWEDDVAPFYEEEETKDDEENVPE